MEYIEVEEFGRTNLGSLRCASRKSHQAPLRETHRAPKKIPESGCSRGGLKNEEYKVGDPSFKRDCIPELSPSTFLRMVTNLLKLDL